MNCTHGCAEGKFLTPKKHGRLRLPEAPVTHDVSRTCFPGVNRLGDFFVNEGITVDGNQKSGQPPGIYKTRRK